MGGTATTGTPSIRLRRSSGGGDRANGNEKLLLLHLRSVSLSLSLPLPPPGSSCFSFPTTRRAALETSKLTNKSSLAKNGTKQKKAGRPSTSPPLLLGGGVRRPLSSSGPASTRPAAFGIGGGGGNKKPSSSNNIGDAVASAAAGASGYVQIANDADVAIDVSGWKLNGGGISFTFVPGTVIPAKDSIYVAASSVAAFKSRGSAPSGGQGLFVVGPLSGTPTGSTDITISSF